VASPKLMHACVALAVSACADPRGLNWYEARCVDRYQRQPGTSEFDYCVARERRIVEETQARRDPSSP
jgi:hypothetical protein